MAHQSTIVENGMTYNVTEFDHTAQEIDDAVSNLGGASTPQGAIAALGAGVRPKLTYNPFFAVNQRGQSSYTVNGYTVDCWKMGSNTATLNVLDDGVKITLNQSPSNDLRLLHQIIENPQDLVGKTVTAAFWITSVSGTGFRCGFRTNSGTISYKYADITTPGLYTVTFEVPSGCTELLLSSIARAGTPSGRSMNIFAATAEIGKTQTLAYQDDSGAIQPLIQQNHTYEDQLAQCQRFFLAGIASDYRAAFISSNMIAFTVPTPVTMRTGPTIIGDFLVKTISGNTQSGFVFNTLRRSGNIRVTATKTSHGLTDALLNIQSNADGFSADL